MPMRRNFLKIQIDTLDKAYSRALARRFTELSSRLEILTYRSDEEYDVLITDKTEYFTINAKEDTILFLEEDDKYLPASILLERAVTIYDKNNKTSFHAGEESKLKSIYFNSPFGGSGTTSIALTFARLLMQMNLNTLFTSIDPLEDFKRYLPICQEPLKNKEQIEYLLSSKRDMILEEFLLRDRYGLSILPLSNMQSMLQIESYIRNRNKYDFLVIDCGRSNIITGGDYQFTIVSANDSRTHPNTPNESQIYNMSTGNGLTSNGLSIAYDPKSFCVLEGCIDIRMDGVFCQGVESIVKRCFDE